MCHRQRHMDNLFCFAVILIFSFVCYTRFLFCLVQDTVVALQALSEMASQIFSGNIQQTITIVGTGFTDTITVNSLNARVLQTRQVQINEPTHEIMALIALRKLNLQTRMRSNPLGLHVWFLVRPFVYFHTLCVRTAKAQARLRGAFAVHLCDKYHNLMSWLKYIYMYSQLITIL